MRMLRRVAVIAGASLLSGCGDGLQPGTAADTTDPLGAVDSVVVSNLSRTPGNLAIVEATSSARVAHIAAPADVFRSGSRGFIRVPERGYSLGFALVDGGIPPVALPLETGDSITIELNDATGGEVVSLSAKVPSARRPRVIRTSPTRKKTDVPLNARITIVFSEPIDTLLALQGIRLLQGSTAVPGLVRPVDRMLDPDGLSIEFVPSGALRPQTGYRIEVGSTIRDLDGQSLEQAFASEFTTGAETVTTPAFIRLAPDSQATIPVGAALQVMATVFDARDIQLNDQPVVWSSSREDVATVTQTGLVTSLSDGFTVILATSGTARRALMLAVSPNPAASVSVIPSSVTLQLQESRLLAPSARDAEGRAIQSFTTTWRTTDPSIVGLYTGFSPSFGSTYAVVTGLAPGSAQIVVTVDTVIRVVPVTVTAPVPGTLKITVLTTGTDPDPDGYPLCVDPSEDVEWGYRCRTYATLPTNGTLDVASEAGQRELWLPEIAANCTADTVRRLTTVPAHAAVDVQFRVNCEHLNVVVPYKANGYRYRILQDAEGLPEFHLLDFDDALPAAGFSTAPAAFGSGLDGQGIDGCDLDTTVVTFWPTDTRLLLRKTFDLPAGVTKLRIGMAIDNDVRVFLNGVDVTVHAGTAVLREGFQMHGGCAAHDSFVVAVPDSVLRAGTNVLAVIVRDRGSTSFADLRVLAKLP